MPIVPKYSDQGGEVALPTRRLTPMSQSQIYSFGQPGRNLARTGQEIFSGGQMLFDKNRKEAEQEARLWVISAETDLEKEMARGTEDLKLDQTPSDYLHDESFKNGSSPDTYTNKVVGLFNDTLGSKDAKGNERYKAPNEYAQKLWDERKMRLQSAYEINAIRYEAGLRSTARLEQLTNTVDEMKNNVFKDPSLLAENLNRLGILIEEKDDKSTPETVEGFSGYIRPEQMIGLHKELAQGLTIQAVKGYIEADPLAAYAVLSGQHKKVGIGDADVAFAINQYLDADDQAVLKNQAEAAAKSEHHADITQFTEDWKQHTFALSKGLPGDPKFNNQDGFKLLGDAPKGRYAGVADGRFTKLHHLVYSMYFGDNYNAKMLLFPELKIQVNAKIKELESELKVSTLAGFMVLDAKAVNKDKIPEFARMLDGLTNRGINDISAKDLAKAFGYEGYVGKADLSILKGMTNYEMAAAIELAQGQISQLLTMRDKDFAEYGIRYGSATEDMTFDQRAEMLKGDAANLNMNANKVNLLTNIEAQTVVSEASKVLQQPEMAAAWIKQQEEKYGPHFEQVWSQLTTMENGLSNDWMILGAYYKTPAALSIGSAISSDHKELKNALSGRPEGSQYSDVEKQRFAQLEPIITSLTGDMPNRDDLRQTITPILEKMIMREMIDNNKDASQAASNVLGMFTHGGLQLSSTTSDKHDWYVLPQHGAIDVPTTVEKIEKFSGYDYDDVIKADSITVSSKGMGFYQYAAAYGGESWATTDLTKTKILVPDSLNSVISADQLYKTQRFYEVVQEHGTWVMSDDGDGIMLTLPVNAGSELLAKQGTGVRIPVMIQRYNQDGTEMTSEPLEIKFSNMSKVTGYFAEDWAAHLRYKAGKDVGSFDDLDLVSP